MSSTVKWQTLISRHLIVAYLRTQSLLQSTKIQLKRYVPDGFILGLSGIPRILSICTGIQVGHVRMLWATGLIYT